MSAFNISILLPTRGRHHRLGTFVDSIIRTANAPIELVFYVDEDDKLTQAAMQELQKIFFDGVKWQVGPKPVRLSDTYNVLFPISTAPIVCYAADDLIFHSQGWDKVVQDEFAKFPDQVLLLYPANQPGVPLHGFMSRKACEVVGYFFPPYFEHGYADRWLMDVYNFVDRSRHCPALQVGHEHWHANKDLFDQVYYERSAKLDEQGRTCDDRDVIIYDAKVAERNEDGAKLKRYIEFFAKSQA